MLGRARALVPNYLDPEAFAVAEGGVPETTALLEHRTGDDQWLRLTRFFGTLLLINFAIAVATGLVQEFQFGMNWSAYQALVGSVFGTPLAIEGLAAFSVESVFVVLCVFGWDRLCRRARSRKCVDSRRSACQRSRGSPRSSGRSAT